MPTKVFISWSGELSRKLGEALRTWLPASLQYVKPYFSPEDIEKGTKWNTEIAKELETSNVGVICLTQENTEKPWIIFEAGALSKSIDQARVCTLLFNLEPAEVKGPLTSFQSTRFNEEDFKRLVITINNTAGDAKLEPSVLDSVFGMWWPKLKKEVDEILHTHNKGGKKDRRSDRDILEEVLDLTRMSASRPKKSIQISEMAVSELMRALDELVYVVNMNAPTDLSHRLASQLDRPLRYLCSESGIPEMYDRYRNRMAHIQNLNKDSDGGQDRGAAT